jgi:C-terminal processing protease CtpA/Prc
VTKFPGAVGVDVANQIADAVREISGCKRLILDLRGNESGGLAFVRVASYLTPEQRTIGYSVTRYGAEHRSLDDLRSFRWIPRKKAGLLWLAVKYGTRDPSVRIETESLGPRPFHGRVVVLIDGRTTGAGERIAAFARDEGLATLLGCRTPGKVICSDSKGVRNGFFVRLPSRAWYSPRKRLLEGCGLEPDVTVAASDDPLHDSQLDRAVEVVSAL